MKTTIATAPDHWVSYLVNGDSSGLNEIEITQADSWLASHAPWAVYDVARDSDGEAEESRFTWHYQLYNPLADCAGGNVLDYVMVAP